MIHKHYGHLLSYDIDINAVSYNSSGVGAAIIEKRDA
jgi:hypothetical protein